MILRIADKKRFFLILSGLILLVILLVVNGRVFSPARPPEPGKKISPPAGIQNTTNPFAALKYGYGFSYGGGEINVPAQIKTYLLPPHQFSPDEIQSLATTFGFNVAPTSDEDRVQGRILFWNQPEAHLQLRLRQGVIKYGLTDPGTISGSALTKDEAESLAQQWLEEKGLFRNLTFKDNVEYLKGVATTASVVEAARAEAVRVSLTYRLNNLPLLDEFLGVDPVSLVILNDRRVAYVSYLFFDPSRLQDQGPVALKTLDLARQSLAKGEGIAVGGFATSADYAPSLPTDTNLSQGYLAYFHSDETSTVQPVFVFENGSARVLVPAIKGL